MVIVLCNVAKCGCNSFANIITESYFFVQTLVLVMLVLKFMYIFKPNKLLLVYNLKHFKIYEAK